VEARGGTTHYSPVGFVVLKLTPHRQPFNRVVLPVYQASAGVPSPLFLAMAKLIYTALTSLDGCVASKGGNFDWVDPHEELHSFVNELARRRLLSLWPTHARGHSRLADPADAQSAVLCVGFREYMAGRREGPLQSFSCRVRARSLRIETKDRDDLTNSDLMHLPE